MALAHQTRGPRRRTRSGVMARAVPRTLAERESGVRLRDDIDESLVDALRAIARACHAAGAGLDVCARRARAAIMAEQTSKLANEAHAIAEAAGALVPGGVRRPSTSERMRWEWLASTAALLDGGHERRVTSEVVRELTVAADAAARLEAFAALALVRDVVDRVRVAAAAGRALIGTAAAGRVCA